MKKENIIINKSFAFALIIIELYKEMQGQKEYVLSKQIHKSGTSIGANVSEATASISKKEFIAKMSITSKEARETKYWLSLLDKSKLVKYDFKNHIEEIDNITNILTAIVKTSQGNS
jgi:four helix bundle protein